MYARRKKSRGARLRGDPKIASKKRNWVKLKSPRKRNTVRKQSGGKNHRKI
jgi:hypothetical protein